MRIKLPFYNVTVAVPAWCVAFCIAWPILFFSFVVHCLVIGGDALNGKGEDGSFFLLNYHRSPGRESRYVEVSGRCYRANYVHGVVMFLMVAPAGIGTWRMISAAGREISRNDATAHGKDKVPD
jgi:hypothetical protein